MRWLNTDYGRIESISSPPISYSSSSLNTDYGRIESMSVVIAVKDCFTLLNTDYGRIERKNGSQYFD